MRCNLVRGDAPKSMRPWDHAQGPVRFSAVVKMNANGNQLSQEISGRLAKPRALLLRPRLAGRIGGSCRDRDAQVLMQSDQPVAGCHFGEVGALNRRAAVSEQRCKLRQFPQLAGELLRPIEAQELARPSTLKVYSAGAGF
jgi:hypothetical protein